VTPTPQQWTLIQELFYAALDLAPAERSRYLDEACAGDQTLRREVDSLLASAQQTVSFLRKPLEEESRQLSGDGYSRGARIGPYEILSLIGEGGMGRVYLAERADHQYEQKVAIKLMHGTLRLSPNMLVRFRGERQILANLDHPNVARLLDGGVTPDGVPYLVMEYVKGIPADEYCRNQKLPVSARLHLFCSICAAVEYAHKNLVIHRDIKCANVLVTAESNPKLLDFGIAKLLDPTKSANETVASERFMTPDYASPEQLRGEPVTTATDIYALGVVLYELLAGTRPFRTDGKSPLETARLICEQEPPAPSVAASPSDRKALQGDLDAIVLKAMRKEPERRYASVGQFAADIHAYLAGYPVTAGRDAWTYRSSKFIRRHKLAFLATAIVAIALIGFGIEMGLLARRANREQLIARTESDFLSSVFRAATPDVARGRTITALELLDQGAHRIAKEDNELANQPEARASLLETIGRAYESLAKFDSAASLGNEAYKLETKLYGPDDPRTAGALELIANNNRLIGHYAEAEPQFRKVVELRKKAAKPDDPAVADSLAALGECLFLLNRDAEAEPILRQSMALYRSISPTLGDGAANYLALLLERKGEYPEAATLLREGLEMAREGKGADSPNYANALHNYSSNLIDLGDLAGAEKGLREDLALRRKLIGNQPDLLFPLNNLSFVLIEKGDAAAAAPFLHDALAIVNGLGEQRFQVVPSVENNWARYLQAQGKWQEAAQAYRKALDDARLISPESWSVDRIISNQGLLYFDQGKYAEAEGYARKALELSRKLGGESTPAYATDLTNLAEDLLFQGDSASAVPLLRQALAIRRLKYNAGNPVIISACVRLGEALTSNGAPAEAEPLLREALQAARTAPFPPLAWQIAEAENALGQCLLRLNRSAEAESLIRNSQAALREHPRPAFRLAAKPIPSHK
jgi:serine/threonine-protein kinase